MADRTLKILEQEMLEEDIRFFEAEIAETIKNTEMDLCIYKHNAEHRGDFRRELRHGNPDCVCLECEGYDDECPSYTKRQ